jgi:hypothetical protein
MSARFPTNMRELEAAEIAVLNHRLALTELAESILREQLEREREQADKERERAERLEVEPQAERQRGFWSRLFGGRG